MPQSVSNRLFKRATLPLKQYKYSHFFIVVKQFILKFTLKPFFLSRKVLLTRKKRHQIGGFPAFTALDVGT